MAKLQDLLNTNYPADQRTNTTTISILDNDKPEGNMDLKDFVNLTILDLARNKLNNSQYLAIIKTIPNKEKLTKLGFYGNEITEPNLDYVVANFPNLDFVDFGENPLDSNFSVKPLSKLTKLKTLKIGKVADKHAFKDTDFLPNSVANYNNHTDINYLNDLRKVSETIILSSDLKKLEAEKTTAEAKATQWKNFWGTIEAEWNKNFQDIKKDLDKGDLTNLKNKIEADIKAKDTTISDLNHTIKDKDKIIDDTKDLPDKITDLNKQLTDKDSELNKRNDSINKLEKEKTDLDQQLKSKDSELVSEKQAKSEADNKLLVKEQELIKIQAKYNQRNDKLLTIEKGEIKKRTELFYQELSLDNNWINEKYGNKDISYLELLANLTGDCEPEEVINAFRVIALIVATDKAQERTDQNKDKLDKLPANFKKNNLIRFNKIKDAWEAIKEEPKEENNPLYLKDIKDQTKYKQQIENIIKLWQ